MDTPDSTTARAFLADPADLAERTGQPAASPALLLALRRTSDRFRDEVGHEVTVVTDDEHWASGDGGSALRLPARPIIGTPIVTIDGRPVSDFQTGRRSGLLRRTAGWPDGLENIMVTYSHGYDPVPGSIADAVLDAAESQMNVTAGLDSVTTGSESVKFSPSAAGGVSDLWSAAVARYETGAGDRS